MTNKIIYLDHAAATPLDTAVLQAMKPYFSEQFYNPSSSYQPAVATRRAVEEARRVIAANIGAASSEITFTAGATESINIVFHSALQPGGHAVITASEHAAVIRAAAPYPHSFIPVDAANQIDLVALEKLIRADTKLVSVALVNNEIGTIQPLKKIAALLETIRRGRRASGNATPLWLHSDASQAAAVMDINCARLGLDFMTLSAAKIYGPKQTGLLWSRKNTNLLTFIHGGGQEKNIRSGTENVPAIIGFASALSAAQARQKVEAVRLQTMRQQFLNQITKNCDGVVVIGVANKLSAPHIVSLSWPDLDAERILFLLETQRILVATGAACAANKAQRSSALTALGLSNQVIDGSLRFSFGRGNSLAQLERAAKIVIATIKQERQRVGETT